MLRKLLEVLTIFSASVFLATAQEVKPTPPKPAAESSQPSKPVEQGGFTFDTTLRKVTTKPETKVVFVEYPFVNNTDETIEIVEYDAPCTCMGARLRRPDGLRSFVFKPGDKGVVIGKLDFENFSGTIDKKIWIRTSKDKKGKPSIVLTARVTIPTLIGPDKPALNWVIGSKLSPQVVFIKVDHDEPINIVKHGLGFGADQSFSYEIETVTAGKLYKVTVTPKSTAKPILGVLRFHTDNKLARYKLVQIFLSTSKAKPNAPKP